MGRLQQAHSVACWVGCSCLMPAQVGSVHQLKVGADAGADDEQDQQQHHDARPKPTWSAEAVIKVFQQVGAHVKSP